MSNNEIIRAWKDPEYRENLTKESRSQLPDNPAGVIEILDKKAQTLVGGKFTDKLTKFTKHPTCTIMTGLLDCTWVFCRD